MVSFSTRNVADFIVERYLFAVNDYSAKIHVSIEIGYHLETLLARNIMIIKMYTIGRANVFPWSITINSASPNNITFSVTYFTPRSWNCWLWENETKLSFRQPINGRVHFTEWPPV